MDILINGKLYDGTQDINYFKQILLDLIDIEYSSLQALKANMISFFDLVEAFCKVERKTRKGGNKAKLTREITKINNQREFWGKVENKDSFVKEYYNYILSGEGLGPLRGLGIADFLGDRITGNAETTRISYKHAN